MAAAKTDKDSKKSFDIKKPGKSAPSASSRPIIVKHAPMMQDPMVADGATAKPSSAPLVANEDDKPEVPELPQSSSSSVIRKKIVPLHDLDNPAEAAAESGLASVDTSKAADTTATEDNKDVGATVDVSVPADEADDFTADETNNSPELSEPAVTSNESKEPKQLEQEADQTDAIKSSDSAAVDALAGRVGTTNKDKAAAEEASRQEAVAKLIADKSYFVTPGHAHQAKGVNMGLVLFIFLVLLLAAAYLVIDAGLFDLGLELPYEFIQN